MLPERYRGSVLEADGGVDLARTQRARSRDGLSDKRRRNAHSAPRGFNNQSVQVASPPVPPNDHAPDDNIAFSCDHQRIWIAS
jgi:hypothetical protein